MRLDPTAMRTDPVAPAERLHRRPDGPSRSPPPCRPSGQHKDLDSGPVRIAINARLFLLVSLGCVAVLVALGLAVAYALVRDAGVPRLIIGALLLDAEANLPTFFAFGLLVVCSVLLALIGARAFLARQAFALHWALLAGLFFLIAFDEAARLHERLNEPVRAALGASGWLYFAWVIPVGGLVAVLALFYVRFLRGLPAPFGRLFVVSGGLYVAGALGAEMIGAAYYEANGNRTFRYQLIATVEEMLEMLGLTVFAYALLRFLAHQPQEVRLSFR